jgi:hypothetical protein
VSENAAVSLGTMSGKHWPSCLGAQYAMAPSSEIAACFVRHAGSSNASKILGSTCRLRFSLFVGEQTGPLKSAKGSKGKGKGKKKMLLKIMNG